MKEIVLVLIGAICAALGGCAASCMAIWYQAKKTRRIRMEEKAADVQFEAQKKALVLIRKLRTLLVKREQDDARNFFCDNGCWFSDNWMFLPEVFCENWKLIGLKLQELRLNEQGQRETPDTGKKGKLIEDAVALGAELPKLAKEAENVLRKEMRLKEAE